METLLSRARDAALGYVQSPSPPPYSNLSAGMLPTVCSYIMGDLSGDDSRTWPVECSKEFGEVGDEGGGYGGATINSIGMLLGNAVVPAFLYEQLG